MINYTIRLAKPADVADLVRLCVDHAAYEKAEYDPAGKCEQLAATLFRPPPPMHCLVVEVASGIVRYATFGLQYSTWRAAEYLYLDCLFIDADFRGLGIGKQMMTLIHDWAVKLGGHEVQWKTPEFNSDAIRFYDRIPQTTRQSQVTLRLACLERLESSNSSFSKKTGKS